MNSKDSDEMPHKAALHQDLHCLLRYEHVTETEIIIPFYRNFDEQHLKLQNRLFHT